MSQHLYSVEQVADLLGLHVKTVRGYVRDGRLRATRIGKQYRIAHEDLEAFTGRTVAGSTREPAPRQLHVEVSSIVQIDAIDPQAMTRISTTLMAVVGRPDPDDPMRIETIYNEERASMKIILLGSPTSTAELLTIIQTLVETRP